MICHESKAIFIHIPRTGGTSVELALIGKNWWQVDRTTKHLTCRQARQVYAEYWDNYFKFSIVRNPWDWLVSLYLSHNKARSEGGRIDWKSYAKNPRLALHEQNSIIQSEIIGDEIDFILKFENLSQDFKLLCSRLSREIAELPHFVAKSGRVDEKDQHYSKFYDDELRDIVARRHKADIRRFNYSFGDVSE
jgi:hypothetical protein